MRKQVLPLLFITNFTLILGFSIVFPLLPFYAKEFGASTLQISILFAAFPLTQFLFSPLWGDISDRIGRKPIILFSLLGSALSFFLFGLAQSYWHLILIRLIHGLVSAAGFSAAQAAGADISTKSERAYVMATLAASFSLAIAAGPAFGGVLSQVSIHFPFFVSAAIAVANLVFVYLLVPETIKERTKKLDLFKGFVFESIFLALKSRLAPMYLMSSVSFLSFGIVGVAYPILALERFNLGPVQVGYIFAFSGLVSALIQAFIVGKVIEKYGEAKVLRAGLVFMFLSMALVAFAFSEVLSAGVLAIMSVGTALINPANNSYISKRSKDQGLALGTLNSFGSLSRFVSPIVVGSLYQVWGPATTFLATAAVVILGYLLSLRIE
ncbi:MAG: MFS transporter [Candidatus Woykebacteria bacterium]